MFWAIDTHTGGQPTRTVIGGLPHIPGDSVEAKMLHLRDQMDWVRQLLMYEPRGSGIMSGAIITPPCHPQADIGIIYIEVGGYLPMCGHDTIGACTALIHSGIIAAEEPVTRMTLDTPAGLVSVWAEVGLGVVRSVSFENVPAFVYRTGVEVDDPVLGRLVCDIAYGGNFYAILPAAAVGLEINPPNARAFIEVANRLMAAINRKLDVVHPERPYIKTVTHVLFSGPPRSPGAHAQNCVVFRPGGIDRSPCGTGTSALVANLHARGDLQIGQDFVHESIIGTTFTARVLTGTSVGGYPAVVPKIAGRAFVTGLHTFVLDPDDPIQSGFLLGV